MFQNHLINSDKTAKNFSLGAKTKNQGKYTFYLGLLTAICTSIIAIALPPKLVLAQTPEATLEAVPKLESSESEIPEAESAVQEPVQEAPQQADSPETETKETNTRENLEALVIREINRARTDPQGYADWLESQKQYYDGMVLRLPGEKPLRTNRGMRTLNEAIIFVRQQPELAPLTTAGQLNATAQNHVNAIINQQQVNYQTKNLVYGKVTPEAIVMQLVVDDGFPDRRHRKAIFTPEQQQAGIVCSEIAVYDQICAIAYKLDSPETTQVATQPAVIVPTVTKASQETEVVTETTGATPTNPEIESVEQEEIPTVEESEKVTSTTTEVEVMEQEETIVVTEAQPETPEQVIIPEPEVAAEPQVTEAPELEQEVTAEVATQPETPVTPKPEETATKAPELETEAVEPTSEPEVEAQTEPEVAETLEQEAITTEPETEVSALPESNPPSQATETIEKGTLQEGDEVIPNDGSFYDSYPIEGTAGDKLIITLESEEFDTFLAVMDKEGNIIEQNDDIDEQNSNSQLEITLPNDGDYTVIVNTYDQDGTGDYVLKLRR